MYVLFVLHGFKLVVGTYQLFLLFKITSLGQWLSYLYFKPWIIFCYILFIYYLFSFLSVFLFSYKCVFVLMTAVFKVLPEIAWIAVFHHRQILINLFFSVCTGLEKIFRVVTKKIGQWGNWKHKYGKYKKKHLGFLIFYLYHITTL
jgi:hypothetical protein